MGVLNHGKDSDAVKKMLNSKVDRTVLQELKTTSSLVETPNNSDKKPDINTLMKIFSDIEDKKKRNRHIVKTYEKGILSI